MWVVNGSKEKIDCYNICLRKYKYHHHRCFMRFLALSIQQSARARYQAHNNFLKNLLKAESHLMRPWYWKQPVVWVSTKTTTNGTLCQPRPSRLPMQRTFFAICFLNNPLQTENCWLGPWWKNPASSFTEFNFFGKSRLEKRPHEKKIWKWAKTQKEIFARKREPMNKI